MIEEDSRLVHTARRSARQEGAPSLTIYMINPVVPVRAMPETRPEEFGLWSVSLHYATPHVGVAPSSNLPEI